MSAELLVITMEECGEVIKECSKEYRFGNNKERLSKEVSGCMAMFLLMHETGLIEFEESDVILKLEKLRKWSNIEGLDPLIEKYK